MKRDSIQEALDLKKILAHYGDDRQKLKAVEELAELIQVIAKGNKHKVLDEVADVIIMVTQLVLIYELEDLIEDHVDMKIDRTLERIKISKEA